MFPAVKDKVFVLAGRAWENPLLPLFSRLRDWVPLVECCAKLLPIGSWSFQLYIMRIVPEEISRSRVSQV